MIHRAVFLLGFLPTLAFPAPPNELDPVVRLYRDFAWEAVIDTPTAGPGLLSQSDAVWSRYFSPRLIKLLRNDRQCVARTREICKLDFSPIWASQDPGAARLKVVPGETPATVNVYFDYPGNGKRISMKFLLQKPDARWLIDDIQYEDGQRLGKLLEARE
ncbi:DUF3828 domain-containing protein [Paucibacter sp. B51]|uniref:DUF3828 domain-containing protein n=1 Tax=Paucibacter sp. B51 TaxID=2993315 RepID=UPI0022C416AD|nr:DUF3828 domain-containing protein [Paucibacter sp. B51]MCZ8073986.1 DUF3828 domain-containing protein [Roseateles sp.]